MNNPHVNRISNRLSLRKPQRESLDILHKVCDIATFEKDADTKDLLKIIQSEYAGVTSFDRDFPSLCFALATGVGKTRLMGAFISYLHLSEGIQDFVLLAPNLTIYNKLIADFTPNTSKYVFKGISEFAQNPPVLITGDNYESGVGVRNSSLFQDSIHINVFNISKIIGSSNDARKIRRLSECIGESYFDYLSGLDDLVILMDESHRYRAAAGMQAINELKPILGLELTATPQVEKGTKTDPFKNVIYNYPIANALIDGYIKEPAVATRENFKPEDYSAEALEEVKLKDGIIIHENTKVELEVYARENSQPIVKPFMLVVAQDTTHANELQTRMESDEFFQGRYKGKVITVHSNTRGEEKDDVVEKLLNVEHRENPVEVVIHVNMLKEGWDVTNLYTIVPLRAANSRTLVEQSIGRGLRLPYGKRVGVPAVDRLTIVSHDRFQDIVDHANDPDSIIRKTVIIGQDIPEAGKKAVLVSSGLDAFLSGTAATESTAEGKSETRPTSKPPAFNTPEERKVAQTANRVMERYEHLRSSKNLLDKAVQAEIAQAVEEELAPYQSELSIEDRPKLDYAAIVKKTAEIRVELSIDIPKIILAPSGDYEGHYEDFTLDLLGVNLQPVSQNVLLQELREHKRYTLETGRGVVEESRLEDYIVRGLIDFNDINYDEHADLLYDLATQVVNHLKNYLKDEDEVVNVLQYHQQVLVNLVHSQMQEHYVEIATDYVAHVTKGFRTLKPLSCMALADESVRNFREAIPDGEKNRIRSMIFGGFERCLYPEQKFDSDSERRFAVILENDSEVLKWFKPAKGDIHISYNRDQNYEPDFIVEAKDCNYLCEPKRSTEVEDDIVQAKAKAAVEWCKHATDHANKNEGKPWKYLLIPHDQINEQMTLSGLAARCTIQ
jgi:type III restriction enzyme